MEIRRQVNATMKNKPNWYLIYTKPSQELAAQMELDKQGYCTYLPKIQHQKKRALSQRKPLTPLFPRYLFIQLTDGIDNWGPIRSTRGVANIVRFGMNPAPISSAAIQAIKSRENESGLHTLSAPLFTENDAVRMTNGPFADYEAIFKEKRPGDRILILLNILGNASPIEVPSDHLIPA